MSVFGILAPDMGGAIGALPDDDAEVVDEVLDNVVEEVDLPDCRLDLAQAVIAPRDQGRIPPDLADPAIREPDLRESTLFRSSVAESLAVLAGGRHTPRRVSGGHR